MDAIRARTKTVILGVALAACYASAADATIVYNTPATSIIASPVYDNVLVDHQSAVVNINSGGVVRGVTDPSAGIFSTAVRTRRGTLNVMGNGRIIADANQSAINMAGNGSVVRLGGRSSVVGDVVNEFTTPGWRSESTALTRLYVQDRARVTGDLIYSGYLRVEDQAMIFGDIRNPSNGSYSLDMRGGLVTGQVVMGGLNDYVFNMQGGAILGGFRGAAGYVDLNMTGGIIANGFETGDFVTGGIYGGIIDGGIDITNGSSGAASHLTIGGGIFEADPGEYLFSMSHERLFGSTLSSSVDIFGGQFGYLDDGLGFFLDEWVDFSIYGWGLSLTNGLLSGFLSDGSWFSNQFTFGSNWNGTFNIVNMFTASALTTGTFDTLSATTLETQSVPEPGTLGILAACMVGMGLFGRRRGGISSRSLKLNPVV